jgi:hypothetical protein
MIQQLLTTICIVVKLLAVHAKRVTIFQKDMELCRTIRRIMLPHQSIFSGDEIAAKVANGTRKYHNGTGTGGTYFAPGQPPI